MKFDIISVFQTSEKYQSFVDDSGLLWLHGSLLCKRLGFSKPSEAIAMHTEEDERMQPESLQSLMPKMKIPWFVNEYGAWGMILAAKTPEAKEFKRYLKYDVLPSIRRNRVYIAPEATKEDIIKAAQERGIELALELNDQQALLTYNAQLQNRVIDFDGLEREWLSISQVLENQGFKLNSKAVDVSLSQIGKNVKKAYKQETGKDPKLTVKQVGQNHGTEIKSYPKDFHQKIVEIALEYWTKKGLLEIVKDV